MTYPDDATMRCLAALASAVEVSTFPLDGEVAARVPLARGGFEWVPVPLAAQEQLEDRGWLLLVGDDEIEVTEAGAYHARKWAVAQERAEKRKLRAGW